MVKRPVERMIIRLMRNMPLIPVNTIKSPRPKE